MPRKAQPDMDAVTLTVVSDELEAEALCGLLRTNGIACTYCRTNFSAGAADGGGWTIAGPTKVLVHARDVAQARKLLPRH
jgi:hypothetical protein